MDENNYHIILDEANQVLSDEIDETHNVNREREDIERDIEQAQMRNHDFDRERDELLLERVELETALCGTDDALDSLNNTGVSQDQVTDFNVTMSSVGSGDGRQSRRGDISENPGDGTIEVDFMNQEKWEEEKKNWIAEADKFKSDVNNFYGKNGSSGSNFASNFSKVEDKAKELEIVKGQFQASVDERRFGNQWVGEIRQLISLIPTLKEVREVIVKKKGEYNRACDGDYRKYN